MATIVLGLAKDLVMAGGVDHDDDDEAARNPHRGREIPLANAMVDQTSKIASHDKSSIREPEFEFNSINECAFFVGKKLVKICMVPERGNMLLEIYKVIFKCLMVRLKGEMTPTVSENQEVFVGGRLIFITLWCVSRGFSP